TKVRLEKSKEHAGVIIVKFVDPADSKKIDDAFLKKFLAELQLQRAADGSQVSFRIKSEVESDIRSKAVTQAKETVHRRIDGLGLNEASLTSRDEDVIIEVPGDDDKAFKDIRATISETARLEFKMVDDNVDYFESMARADEKDLPKGFS